MIKKILLCTYFSLVLAQVDSTITVDASDYNEWIYLYLRRNKRKYQRSNWND